MIEGVWYMIEGVWYMIEGDRFGLVGCDISGGTQCLISILFKIIIIIS